MLELRNIKKDYITASETVNALKGVDLTFRDKEFVSILGPSGCGKTTLLNIIGGLDHYTSGDLIISGRSTKDYKDRDWDVYRNHRVGFIFQSYNLIPHQTILGNVELALTIAGMSKGERIKKAKNALDRVGLRGQYYKRPNQLSGGQCQRVAIARALVNDPEILLADEPTGALDTKTSKQIMNLIREISGERLVIMVTHNPELADKYSTRIINLLDGNVVRDTNPVTDKELAQAYSKRNVRKMQKAEKRSQSEKAKMSLWTAFKLSARNLISKKGRTTMVGFAGSIGIIGIALVLAFSTGIKGYIASMQDDMLSGNPISISQSTYDIDALTGMMNDRLNEEIKSESGKVFINSLIKYIMETSSQMDSFVIKNDITEDYIKYLDQMPKEYYAAMVKNYGINMLYNIYTDFKLTESTDPQRISIEALTERYKSILNETDFKDYSSYITSIVPSFKQAPNNVEYIEHQYDVVGRVASEKDEIMLVLDSNDRLSDVLLARLGYYTEEEFINIIHETNGELTEGAPYKEYFTYEELLGKTFTWYENDQIFTDSTSAMKSVPFDYQYDAANVEGDGLELKVVGILLVKDTTTYGCLTSGIYYTEALTNHVLEKNLHSKITDYINNEKGGELQYLASAMQGIYYTYKYTYDGVEKTATSYIGDGLGLESMMGAMGSMGGSSGGSTGGSTGGSAGGSAGGMGGMTGGMGGLGSLGSLTGSIKTLSAASLGGSDLATSLSIYPVSFDDKDLVTSYLDQWNDSSVTIEIDGKVLKGDERSDIKYMDALELVIVLINTMIDVISYALIAFTSISLVVSTVMIGIITYVSVVERIKEIGVIRSLGGRKKDVSHLFNAETFIIGLLSGGIGVGISYLISYIASEIVMRLASVPNIATLDPKHAILLIALSVVLTLISGLIPSRSAANKDPVDALRTE